MNCQRVRQALSAYQDGELRPALGMEVEHHLQSCPTCRAEQNSLQELVKRLRRVSPPAVDPFFSTRVMAGRQLHPIRKSRLLPAAAYALVFVTIFLAGFLLQTFDGGQAPAEPLSSTTFSAVLLESRDFGLLSVQEDTLRMFPGSDHGQK
jgi:anti-sigma factor RsiW